MGIQERRSREKEELRDKILAAARELFAADGYEAVTMRRIAEAIEYSPTAIYLHFADKLDVLRACCQEDFGALAAKFQRIAKIADPVERLAATGKAYAEFAFQHPNHYRLMFMTPHPPIAPDSTELERGNPEQDAYAFLKWTVSEAVAAGRFRSELADLELLSQVIWSGVHGVVSLRIAKCNDPWVEWRAERKSVETMIDVLLHGLLAPARSGKKR
ncbi:MAG: TetR/AcrR family transcriptional regulator [Thermoanaerobaculia bacterium]